ncbi:septal ring lytic transglycosylase RlpA family protein [Hymenobacter ruricola]|uniref:Probable endolytic peptidoglycan transglycosylase RlpA n=1 Tax=Hymenobacter ruricola TaxID=2791023 RepID=A0ABS0I3T8_9BACT|nr:septal ring lytic transglycosylase RlpA family protein [Hymenobacter ruricola]MBF9221620.1 septal ring lytic transglycosylase RlpA family protein [Hymenobacter ruricola]
MKHYLKAKFLYLRPFGPLRWALPALLLATSCGGSRNAFTQSGQGSYYADKFAGRPTTSGAPYRPGKMTAAHNTLPFGTRIKVTNVRNGKSVKVTVNDRGPHVKGRIVDVSRKAAQKLDLVDAGVVPVQLKVIKAAPKK